jgi:hypothetical protein
VNGYGKKFHRPNVPASSEKETVTRILTTLTPASDEQTKKRVSVPFHPPITNKNCFQETQNKNGPPNQRQTW